MTTADLWPALGAALAAAWGEFTVVTGRDGSAAAALVTASRQPPVTVAGDTARLAVAVGIAAAGGRAVVALGSRVCPPGTGDLLAVTEAPAAATAALEHGWAVARPALPGDVAPLLAQLPDRAVMYLGPVAAADEPAPAPAGSGPRFWRSGDALTLVASGPAVDVMLPLSRMLGARGLPTAAVEVALVTRRSQRPLLARDAVLAGPTEAAEQLRAGRWPGSVLQPLDVRGRTPRQLMEQILATVRVSGRR